MFIQYGCGSCHALRDVRGATGSVGPPLDGIAVRAIIGGHLANTPTTCSDGSAIPSTSRPEPRCPTSVSAARTRRDITAFLYTRAK